MWKVTLGLLAIAGLYLVAYALTVDRVLYATEGGLGVIFDGYVADEYGTDSPTVRLLFAPAHWLDRQARPDYWSKDRLYDGQEWKP